MNKAQQLRKLRDVCLNCRKCVVGGKRLFDGSLSNVFSNMCMKARIMVVGQNPGEQEVRQGFPFVGPSGKFFDEAIDKVLGVDRSCFYICNTIRCHTPGNRHPYADEIENCRYLLEGEIKVIKPVVVVTLGAFALKQITGLTGISKRHGQDLVSIRYGVRVVPMFHPSPLNMNSSVRCQMFYSDLEALRKFL